MDRGIDVVVVDDRVLFRDALAVCLRAESSIGSVQALPCAALAENPARVADADVVVFGQDGGGTTVFSTARTIGNHDGATPVLLVCILPKDHVIRQALSCGARGILTRTDSLGSMLEAIRTVSGGDWYFSPVIRDRVVVSDGRAVLAHRSDSTFAALSPRELQVLDYLATGSSKKEIAQKLGLSVGTINNHAANLMRKLDCHDRVELTRLAIREGLVAP